MFIHHRLSRSVGVDCSCPSQDLLNFVFAPALEAPGLDQVAQAMKGSTTDAFACDVGKPGFDLVQPKGTRSFYVF